MDKYISVTKTCENIPQMIEMIEEKLKAPLSKTEKIEITKPIRELNFARQELCNVE